MRIAEIVQQRDARTREFFAAVPGGGEPDELAPEVPAYLSALSVLVPDRELAIDAGTGDGSLLDALAPVFRRVIAIDRSAAQLERARGRVERRGYANVSFLHGEIDSERLTSLVGAGADVVVASRMLHHARCPRAAVQQLSALLRPGGRLLVIDYERHADEAFARAPGGRLERASTRANSRPMLGPRVSAMCMSRGCRGASSARPATATSAGRC